MNTKAEASPGVLDTVKLVAAVAVFFGGIVGYYFFSEASLLWRVLGLLACLFAGLGIAFTTVQGRQLWEFIQGSQIELRKVVWPDRRETLNTTLIVLGLTAVVALFFLMVDAILLKLTQFVTGQGG
jgi:preprotein translocase subunit SecE